MALLDLGKYPLPGAPAQKPVIDPLFAKLNAESRQGQINEKGTPNPSGYVAPWLTTSGSGLDFTITPTGGTRTNASGLGTYGITQGLPTMQPAQPEAAQPAAAPPTATPAALARVSAAKPATAPEFMPTLSGPNTVQDMVSEGRNLMATQGIGGFVQAKGLNRMAQTINQENAPLIQGQYGLQTAALTANERLEQAKLAEHQRQQLQETWTPDKSITGELIGYGRTKGGRPEYVTKESLMSKPTLAQFLAKAKPVNPKATDAELTAHYNATYATE